MACTRFLDKEGTTHAFARFSYDTKETAAYAADQDAADEEQLGTDIGPEPRCPVRRGRGLAGRGTGGSRLALPPATHARQVGGGARHRRHAR
jgi:hypothetical protein